MPSNQGYSYKSSGTNSQVSVAILIITISSYLASAYPYWGLSPQVNPNHYIRAPKPISTCS
ncbi:hypothetical protein RRF57_012922 [Xylaria bambusicola]|uniref:Uncharacterized protein n=1 Tax=Xylaria bambusicola TaxID=326684 RepID=A0AAN7UQU7_9PEZI